MTDIDDVLLEQLRSHATFLPDMPEETAESTLRALYCAAANTPMSAQLAAECPVPVLDQAARSRLDDLVRRRIGGTPLAHLTGRQSFMGLEMLAGPQALVPRKETEILGRVAVEIVARLAGSGSPVLVVDACTGSGNVALAIAHDSPVASVIGTDLSADAVALAKKNADHLGLADRTEFRVGDLLSPVDEDLMVGRVDLLTCNPPYITSGKVDNLSPQIGDHEPRIAFDGGPFGVAILVKLIQEAPRYLRSGGYLAFEVGLGQGAALVKRLARSGAYGPPVATSDDAGETRVIAAQRL